MKNTNFFFSMEENSILFDNAFDYCFNYSIYYCGNRRRNRQNVYHGNMLPSRLFCELLYFKDTGLLIGSLDEEAQDDLRKNQNFNTYKGAIYENVIADMLVKQGYYLYFYKNEKGALEMDFFIRDKDSLIPVEVKANDNSTISLNNLIDNYDDIKFGIKLCNKNIGFNGKFYTFPYFLAFLLKRYLKNK